MVLVLVLGGQILVHVLRGQVLVLVLVLGGQVLVLGGQVLVKIPASTSIISLRLLSTMENSLWQLGLVVSPSTHPPSLPNMTLFYHEIVGLIKRIAL